MHFVHRFFATFIPLFLMAMPVHADVESARKLVNDLKNQINAATNEDITALHKKLTDVLDEYGGGDSSVGNTDTAKNAQIEVLKANAQKLRETEQSLENRLLGTAGLGAVGIGGMQTMSAIAEQGADDAAERDMRAYLATFRCDYGHGRNIVGGETGVQLPGANELSDYVTEYQTLAAQLQADKAALGMSPGVESELVLDSATMNLYQNESLERQKGAFTSLSRALLDENSADAAEWAQQHQSTLNKRQVGTALAVGGAVATLAGNLGINGLNNKSNTPKADSDNDNIVPAADDYANLSLVERVSALESDLNELIAENARMMTEYNDSLKQHQLVVNTISPQCRDALADYINDIKGLQPVSDKLQRIPEIKYDLENVKTRHQKCIKSDRTEKKIDGKQGLQNVCLGIPKQNYKCVKKFEWINVNMIQAVRIAREYIRVVEHKTLDYCDEQWHKYGPDDNVSCRATDGTLYTFMFDDVTETSGDTIRKDTAIAICEGVYNGKSGRVGAYDGKTVSVGGINCAFNTTNAQKTCEAMGEILKDFDFNTFTANNQKACSIYFTPYMDYVGTGRNRTTKRIPVRGQRKYVENNQHYGIDNFEFRKGGYQMRGDVAVVRLIEHWLSMKTGVPGNKIRCNDGTTTYFGNDATSGADDILACFIDGKRVDLVFDDFSENWNDYTKNFLQAGVCKIKNGVYTGNSCTGQTQQMDKNGCENLAAVLQNYCPRCELPKWDPKTGVCKTHENAAFVKFADEYGPQLGLTVVSVALAIPTGGASMTMSAIVAWDAAVVGALATVISIQADETMVADVTNFINSVSGKCYSPSSCSPAQQRKCTIHGTERSICTVESCTIDGKTQSLDNILKEYLKRMLNLTKTIPPAQAVALDSELARLLCMLPSNNPMLNQFVAEYNKGGKDTEETIQKIRRAAEIVGIVANTVGLVTTFQFPESSAVLKNLTSIGVGIGSY